MRRAKGAVHGNKQCSSPRSCPKLTQLDVRRSLRAGCMLTCVILPCAYNMAAGVSTSNRRSSGRARLYDATTPQPRCTHRERGHRRVADARCAEPNGNAAGWQRGCMTTGDWCARTGPHRDAEPEGCCTIPVCAAVWKSRAAPVEQTCASLMRSQQRARTAETSTRTAPPHSGLCRRHCLSTWLTATSGQRLAHAPRALRTARVGMS